MDVNGCSETLMTFHQATGRHIPQDGNVHIHRSKNFKSNETIKGEGERFKKEAALLQVNKNLRYSSH
jgi:hypothetical protein